MSRAATAGAGAGAGAPSTPGRDRKDSLTAEEREAQVMELLARLKEASRRPEQAAQRIRDLDKIVSRLRKNRDICEKARVADTELIAQLKKQEEMLAAKLRPIEERLAEREEAAEKMRSQMEMAMESMGGFINSATTRVTQARVSDAKMRKKFVSQSLRAERGFSTDAASKPHREVPASMKSRLRK